jgi:hypothetical protein
MEHQIKGSALQCDPSTSGSVVDSHYCEVGSDIEDIYEEEDLHLYLSDSEEDTPRKTGSVFHNVFD